MEKSFETWKEGLVTTICQNKNPSVLEQNIVTEEEQKEEEEEINYDSEEEYEEQPELIGSDGEDQVVDLEDLGSVASKIQKAKKDKQLEEDSYDDAAAKISLNGTVGSYFFFFSFFVFFCFLFCFLFFLFFVLFFALFYIIYT